MQRSLGAAPRALCLSTSPHRRSILVRSQNNKPKGTSFDPLTLIGTTVKPPQQQQQQQQSPRPWQGTTQRKQQQTQPQQHGWQAQILYKYFNWRQNSFSDLQVILLLNLLVIAVAAVLHLLLVHGSRSLGVWNDLYWAAVTSFGEGFPSSTAPAAEQAFSLGLYLTGLIGFAVLLALVEQSVMQVYEARVELGSPVLERGHILILSWCRSDCDVSMLEVVLRQLCAAHACSGGRMIVVLSQRKKTEMESEFAVAIPQHQRGGSRFVFRQGSPLNAADLSLVAADEASTVMVLSDSAAGPDASDSQVLRVLVMLDEAEVAARQEGRQRPAPGHVVAEIQSTDALPLLAFVPVKPVIPVPGNRVNAGRVARMILRPAVMSVADRVWDFSNSVALYMHAFPELAGCTMEDVALRFEDGVVVGVQDTASGAVVINPPKEYVFTASEQIILLRPTSIPPCEVRPLPAAPPAPVGNFSPAAANVDQTLHLPKVVSCACPELEAAGSPSVMSNIRSMQDSLDPRSMHSSSLHGSLDGSLDSSSSASRTSRQLSPLAAMRSMDEQGDDFSGTVAAGSMHVVPPAAAPGLEAAVAGSSEAGAAVTSWQEPLSAFDDLTSLSSAGGSCRLFSLAESSMQLDKSQPVNLLVLGWGQQNFMTSLLLALGTGSTALPAGSTVTFANAHFAGASLEPALAAAGGRELLSGLTINYKQLDPLQRCQMSHLDLQSVDACVVLCDEAWRLQVSQQQSFLLHGAHPPSAPVFGSNGGSSSPGSSRDSGSIPGPYNSFSTASSTLAGAGAAAGAASGFSGLPGGANADVLQLDALLLRVQLNLRSLLQESGREGQVNIVTEKVGTEPDTRFEDRARLPLGVPLNLRSYTAVLMSHLAFCPTMVLPRTLDSQIDPLFVDADLYVAVGEKVSYLQLVRRAQLLGHLLLGFYRLPVSSSDAIEAVLCPPRELRYEPRTWNTGDNRLKFVILQDVTEQRQRQQQQQHQQQKEQQLQLVTAGTHQPLEL